MKSERHTRQKKTRPNIKRIKTITASVRGRNSQAQDKSGFSAKAEENSQPAVYSDVLGSYTGMTYDNEAPVQDADDL